MSAQVIAVTYGEILPVVSPLPDGETWRMEKDWHVKICLSNMTSNLIVIPKGFEFNFASIPKFAWSIVGGPATGLHRYGSILHDYMYFTQFFQDRLYADDVFYAFNKQEGLGTVKNTTMYRVLRMFGNRAWVNSPGQPMPRPYYM